MQVDRRPAQVIDLEVARAARMPAIVFGSVEIEDDRIRLRADTRLTAHAAETLARELYRLAGILREGGEHG